MIQIDAGSAVLIGDALCHVPYMAWLCKKHDTRARIHGYNKYVADLLSKTYPFDFTDGLDNSIPQFRLSIHEAFPLFHDQCHMAQAFFKQNNEPPPPLPIQLDFQEEPCGLPAGLVVAPFSRSDLNNNKLWPHERWIEVIQKLRCEGAIDRAYVVGVSGRDDHALYAGAGIDPIFDRPLSQVLHLLRQAPVFLSIDNGISHIAHFGGVRRHVLLYPGCLPKCWVENPHAIQVTADCPINVQTDSILAGARQLLELV